MAQGLAGADQGCLVPVSAQLRRELGFLPLIAVVFFNVSGGPYGIEDTVGVFGPGLVLLLLLLTPLVWSLPVCLAMAELASALPEEGGYVAWVRRAFGPFWGFQAGWWSWVNSFVDVAVYPALFADYLMFWWPGMSTLERWAAALAFVWILTALNLAGVRVTGWSAAVLGVIVLAPMAVFTVVAAAHARQLPWVPFANERQGALAGLGLGLATMMWNYSGWDTPTTCLGETKAPATAFRRAVWSALPLIEIAGSSWTPGPKERSNMDPFLVYSFCCVSFLLGMMVLLIIDYIACGTHPARLMAKARIQNNERATKSVGMIKHNSTYDACFLR